MACGSCAARRAALAAGQYKFVWTSSDGSETVTYDTEVMAKAKVMRKGGSYQPVQSG